MIRLGQVWEYIHSSTTTSMFVVVTAHARARWSLLNLSTGDVGWIVTEEQLLARENDQPRAGWSHCWRRFA